MNEKERYEKRSKGESKLCENLKCCYIEDQERNEEMG
jgi:hypothetical protein